VIIFSAFSEMCRQVTVAPFRVAVLRTQSRLRLARRVAKGGPILQFLYAEFVNIQFYA
jgi:hypothetical protein